MRVTSCGQALLHFGTHRYELDSGLAEQVVPTRRGGRQAEQGYLREDFLVPERVVERVVRVRAVRGIAPRAARDFAASFFFALLLYMEARGSSS